MIKKSIFITGGAGYVGSRLVPELLNDGYKVTVYDIMYYGNDFLPKSNLNIISGDIRDSTKLEEALKIMKFFYIWRVYQMIIVLSLMKTFNKY